MEGSKCQISISLAPEEKQLLEKMSKRSRVECSEMIRILLFETGILLRNSSRNYDI